MVRHGLAYTVLALVLTWPLATRLGSAMPIGGDNQYVAWSLAWIAHAAVTSPTSLFSANIFFPAERSLAFSDPNVSSALLVAPMYYVFGNPALVLNLLFLSSFVLCGLAAAALCREWTGSDHGAFAAGALFSFSPLRFSHFDHIQLYAFWWTPIALLGVDRFVRGGRWRSLALSVLALTCQAYASVYLAAFAAAATTLLLLVRIAGREAGVWRRSLVATGVLVVIGAILCAPMAWAYGSVRLTWGASRSLEQNIRFSASPLDYLSVLPGNLVWGRWLAGFANPIAPWEKFLFPGLAPLLLAFVALRRARGVSVGFGLLLAAAAAVASLGPSLVWRGHDTAIALPYRLAYDWLPPLQGLRAPARWALLASLGLSLAAGAGAAQLGRRVAGLLVTMALLEAVAIPLPIWSVPIGPAETAAYRELATGQGALVELPLARTAEQRYERETARVYASTLHWRPIANGYSGYTPPTYTALVDLATRLSPAALVRLLPSWEIRSIVLHLDELPDEERSAWAAVEREGLARRVSQVGTIRVLEIITHTAFDSRRSATPRPARPLLAGRWQPVEIEFTADPAALLPPRGIGWHRAQIAWRSAAGDVQGLRAKVFCPPALYAGHPWHTLFVKAPALGGRYRMELEGACFDLGGEVTVGPPAP